MDSHYTHIYMYIYIYIYIIDNIYYYQLLTIYLSSLIFTKISLLLCTNLIISICLRITVPIMSYCVARSVSARSRANHCGPTTILSMREFDTTTAGKTTIKIKLIIQYISILTRSWPPLLVRIKPLLRKLSTMHRDVSLPQRRCLG